VRTKTEDLATGSTRSWVSSLKNQMGGVPFRHCDIKENGRGKRITKIGVLKM
jgi:hypothetical protein